MFWNYKKYFMMTGILLILLSCIPREDPPDKILFLDEINVLPSQLSENSGIVSFSGLIWYINDSGNEPEIYGYSREQNAVVKTIFVKGLSNNDWEDVTQNENYLFIGDFGNNSGSRTDLNIICIDKDALQAATDTIEATGIISFAYEDQIDFTSSPQETPYDCEAFISTADSIFLFTKDWVTQKTRIYSLPVIPGNYSARFIDQWNVDGLITSAAWSDESNQLYLLGYTPVVPFLLVYSGFNANTLKYESVKRTDFEDYIGTQTEGIAITENGTVIITSEASLGIPARFFILREE